MLACILLKAPKFVFSLAITKTSGNQSLNFIANKIETRDINFRLDNRKHPACQGNLFSFYNNATQPKGTSSFPEN